MLALFAQFGCSGGEPISSKTSKFEVADDSDAATSAKTQEGLKKRDAQATTLQEKEEPNKSLANTAKKPIAEGSASDQEAGQTTPKREESGLYKAPKGPPSVQLEFIKRLSEAKLRGNSQQSQMVDYEDKSIAIIASCDAILAHKQATDEEKRAAITTKFLELTRMSAVLEKAEYAKQAMDFAAELQTKKKGTVDQELGVAIGAALLPEQFGRLQKPTDADVKKLVEGYLSYLAEGPLTPLHEPGLSTAQLLYSIGRRKEAIAICEAMLSSFSAEKSLQNGEDLVDDIESTLRAIRLDFTKKLIAASQNDEAFAEFDNALGEFVKERKVNGKLLQSIYQAASMLERSGKSGSASTIFDRLAKMDDSNVPKEIAKQLKSLLESATARKSILATPWDFTAIDSEEKAFKLSSLKGKRVLVLFWSARDQGSMHELANIEQTLMATKNAFEVVVVNVDDDPKLFKQFSASQKIPFAVASVLCPEADKPGATSDLEQHIGLNQVPYSVLVDAEGKVEAVFAQGPRLEALVTADAATSAEKSDAEKSPPTEEKSDATPNSAAKKSDESPKST